MSDRYYDDWEWEDGDCSWCGGDGMTECDDPIQCMNVHSGGYCECSACNGSGLASEQWIW